MAYLKSKLTVIDKEMLLRAIMDRQSKEAEHVSQGGIEFNKVPKLQLAFKNILKIANLWEFTSLTKLELNNNSIKKIEGLDHLKNLTWLNLSFNYIEKIEGLESLRKLEFLNLLKNEISVIENIDTLEELNLFSIANNCLGQLDDVICLRKFKKLRTLNLYGNPLCQEDNYKLFIAAHFPDLQYLDYDLLDETTKNQANVEFWYIIEEMRDKELQVQKAVEAKLGQETGLQLHKDAFVEFLNGSQLFKSMFTDDPLKDKLHRLPGVDDLLRAYKHQMVELCKQLFATGLTVHKRREAEVNSFSSQKNGIADNQQKASQMVADFEQHHTEMFEDFQGLSDADLSQYTVEIDQLCENLMKLEFQLVTQLGDNIKTFDRDISSMVETLRIAFRKTLEQCRELERNHHEKMQEIAVATLEKVATGNVEDMPDNVRQLFEDKDLVMEALATAHKNHLQKINDRETQFVTRANAWKTDLLAEIQDKEMQRNHNRVSEIHRYVDHLKDELEGLQ